MPSSAQPAEIIELVERFTGQRRVTNINEAQVLFSTAQTDLQRSKSHLRGINPRRLRAAGSLIAARLWAFVVRLPIQFRVEPLVIVAMVGAVLAIIPGVICILVIHTSLLPAALVTVLPLVALFSASPLLFRHPFGEIELLAQRKAAVLYSLTRERSDAKAVVGKSKERLDEIQRIRDGIIRANEQPLLRLLNANIRAMSGGDFERHLANIFRFRGYQVEQMGQTGDQGVDLIISLGPGSRIAVQAKCYGGSVGNSAIQEVYTGMAVHRCQRCVVVTSSYFTTGA